MVNQIQLLPHESQQHLTDLETHYQFEFPTTTYLGQTLRHIFIKADWQRHRAEAAYDRFELDLYQTGLPMHYWEPCVHRQLHFLQRHKQAVHRHFNRSLQMPQSIPKFKPTPKAAEPTPPPDITPLKGRTYRQTVWTSYVDGVLTTITDHGAAYWLEREATHGAIDFIRYFHFPNADIPEPFRYLLTNPDDGSIEQNPKPYIAAYYEPQEFYRICTLEVESNSPHLIGGQPFDITYTS